LPVVLPHISQNDARESADAMCVQEHDTLLQTNLIRRKGIESLLQVFLLPLSQGKTSNEQK
jgi:hypothetical protein